jgi:subtilisin family serine protease
MLGVSKPDVTAPGVQILAGQTPAPADPADPPGELFQAIAGTSMSSPHVAGAAALLKHLHPDWTPGQIKSALMTTASRDGLVKEDGVTPFTPFDAGTGRIDLKAAQSPGLTFDVPVSEYIAHAADLWTANHPSVYVPDIAPNSLAVRRTALSVASKATTWTLTIIPDALPGLSVTVPPTVTVAGGASTPFDIQIDKSGVPGGAARHAILRMTSSQTTLHLPITAAGPVPRPDLVISAVSAPSTGTRGVAMTSAATVQNIGTGAASAFTFQVYLSRNDAVVNAGDTPYWFCRFGSLAPGASSACDFTGEIPSSIEPGTYFLVVRADDADAIAERDETNNVSSAGPITID